MMLIGYINGLLVQTRNSWECHINSVFAKSDVT